MGAWSQDRQSLEPTGQPTELDVCFFAGFYEGEGSATPTKAGAVVVQMPQKDPENLYKGRALFGGSVRPVKGRDIFAWLITGDRARLFLQSIYPLLSNRRKEQIDRTSAFQLTGRKSISVSGMTPERAAARALMTSAERHRETCNKWGAENAGKKFAQTRKWQKANQEHVNQLQRERRKRLRESKYGYQSETVTKNSERNQRVN